MKAEAVKRAIVDNISPRTEQDFVEYIRATIAKAPEAGWMFVLDQLNIYRSESLVRFVASECELTTDLGEKGQQGILALHVFSCRISQLTLIIEFVLFMSQSTHLG